MEALSAPASFARENTTVLIVYEETGERNRLRDIFEEAGYRALTVSDAPSALRVIHRERCDRLCPQAHLPVRPTGLRQISRSSLLSW